MDYQAILAALDARTKDAFQGWAETFLADVAGQLSERDQTIAAQAEQIKAMQALLEQQDERLTHALAELLTAAREAAEEAHKQVRAELARLPVPTYKGVFDRGADYQSGDMVTHKGSIWHCNAASSGEAPGPGEAWTLAVKCGRDGKDLTKEAAE